MAVGFIHGVMNTDNTTISGETIDYGPCAFMDVYDPATVFSSIDHAGRYAYGNQPAIVTWNLARLAEAMLPLFDADTDRAIEMANGVLATFPDQFRQAWSAEMHAKLGLAADAPDGDALIADLLTLMAEQRVDYTSCLRSLSSMVRGDTEPARSLFADPVCVRRLERGAGMAAARRRPCGDRRPNGPGEPDLHPEEPPGGRCLGRRDRRDLHPFEQLLEVVTNPFEQREGWERYESGAPTDAPPHRTFCGT